MKLQTKPHPWSCLATAFAMATDTDIKLFHYILGHTGEEIAFPELPEPQCRVGIHIMEAIYAAWRLGYSSTPMELMPAVQGNGISTKRHIHYGNVHETKSNWTLFNEVAETRSGVIEYQTIRGNWHAVTFDHGGILDPDGREYEFTPEECERRGLRIYRLWIIERK